MDIREKLVELLDDMQRSGTGYFGNAIENKKIVDYLIAHGVTVQEWIPVAERLPKPFTPVLVFRKSFDILPPYIKVDKMVLWNDGTQVWTDEMGTWKAATTHWMPLPHPPKGE